MAHHLTRDEEKERYHAYRQRARELFEDVGPVDSSNIHVEENATVQMVESGAFVEAILWVPLEELRNKK